MASGMLELLRATCDSVLFTAPNEVVLRFTGRLPNGSGYVDELCLLMPNGIWRLTNTVISSPSRRR